jgi:hypothetical protein
MLTVGSPSGVLQGGPSLPCRTSRFSTGNNGPPPPGLTSLLRCCRASEPAGLRPGRSSAPAGNRPTRWTWTPVVAGSGPYRSTCWPSRRSTGHRPGESSLTLPGAALRQALKAHRWCPRPSRRSRLHQVHASFLPRGPAQILVRAAPSSSPWLPEGYVHPCGRAASRTDGFLAFS